MVLLWPSVWWLVFLTISSFGCSVEYTVHGTAKVAPGICKLGTQSGPCESAPMPDNSVQYAVYTMPNNHNKPMWSIRGIIWSILGCRSGSFLWNSRLLTWFLKRCYICIISRSVSGFFPIVQCKCEQCVVTMFLCHGEITGHSALFLAQVNSGMDLMHKWL